MYTKYKAQHFDCTFAEMVDVCNRFNREPLHRKNEEGEVYHENWVSLNINDVGHTWFLDWDYEDQWNEYWKED